MVVDLARGAVAVRFRGLDHAIDGLEEVELSAGTMGGDAFYCDHGGGEMLLDRPDGAVLTPQLSGSQSACAQPTSGDIP